MILQSLIFFTLQANAGEDPASLAFAAKISNKSPYALSFTPPKAHHFNLQAPATVDAVTGEASVRAKLAKGPQLVAANFDTLKIDKECVVKANLYVCNDAETYCRPVKQDFECETLSLKR
jgi:hypothetical protein